MASFPNRSLNQTAVYWDNPSPSGWGGDSWDDPAEVDCRWEKKQELFIDATGEEKRSSAVVYLNQDVDLGGYLMLGDLDDIPSDSQLPTDFSGAFEIRGFNKIPNIKGTKFERKAWL